MAKLFTRAERRRAKLKVALTGPSGAGKTWSALAVAFGISDKVAVIDTENDSACLYAGGVFPPFDVVTIEPPYTVEKYLAAMKGAVAEGYEVVVVDSLSHVWKAEGGLLEQKSALDSRGGNSFTNWSSISKMHERLLAQIINSDIHLIATMRSKMDYVMQSGERGKQEVKKVGLAPIQREGMEYEFTLVLDLAMDHSASASKDRTSIFDGKVFTPSVATGKELLKWLAAGVDVPRTNVLPDSVVQRSSVQMFGAGGDPGIGVVTDLFQRLGINKSGDQLRALRAKFPGIRSFLDLSGQQINALVDGLTMAAEDQGQKTVFLEWFNGLTKDAQPELPVVK